MSAGVFIFCNGIEYDTAHDGWCDRAAAWVINHTPHRAMLHEYECDWWSRWIGQAKRSRALADKVNGIGGATPVHLVGHSNGCDVIRRALPLIRRPVNSAHLIAAACDADMEGTGLAPALRSHKLRRLALYCSESDLALKAAKWSRVLRPFGLGYGSMGRTGPEQDCGPEFGDRVEVIWHPGYGHSSYFAPANFDALMRRVTGMEA